MLFPQVENTDSLSLEQSRRAIDLLNGALKTRCETIKSSSLSAVIALSCSLSYVQLGTQEDGRTSEELHTTSSNGNLKTPW